MLKCPDYSVDTYPGNVTMILPYSITKGYGKLKYIEKKTVKLRKGLAVQRRRNRR